MRTAADSHHSAAAWQGRSKLKRQVAAQQPLKSKRKRSTLSNGRRRKQRSLLRELARELPVIENLVVRLIALLAIIEVLISKAGPIVRATPTMSTEGQHVLATVANGALWLVVLLYQLHRNTTSRRSPTG